MSKILISADRLQQFCESVLQTSLPVKEANIIAETLVYAELRGISSHGVQRLEGSLKRMEDGLIEKETDISIVKETPATALLDANNGWGPVASLRAMEMAIEKAQTLGCSFVGVKNSNHFGTAAFFTNMAAKKGLIGFALTNASPLMVPHGGKEPTLGANPISIAIPTGDGEEPIILDMSTSAVARGKIMLAKKNNETIPEGWAITKDGSPTTDPSEAWDGYVLPLGAKGSGLAIMIDLLSGALTGSLFGKQVPRQYEDPYPQQLGHLFGAINVESFIDLEEFTQKVKMKKDETNNCEPAQGFDRVYMPGERSWLKKEQRLSEGIPLSTEIFNELKETGQKYNVNISEYL